MEVGFRFCPLDEELVGHYLVKKINNEQLPADCPVKDFDLYGKWEPWEIWDRYGGEGLLDGQFLYFFTKQKRRSSAGSRIQRTIGTGTWHGDTSAKHVYNRKKEVIGMITKFHYKNVKSVHNGGWLMREFSLVNQSSDSVLCCLKKNSSSKFAKKIKVDEFDVGNDVDDTNTGELKRLMKFQWRGKKQRLADINNIEAEATESCWESANTLTGSGDGLRDDNLWSSYGIRVEKSLNLTSDAATLGNTVNSHNANTDGGVTAIESFWATSTTQIGDVDNMELAVSLPTSFDWSGYENCISLDDSKRVERSLLPEVGEVLSLDDSKRVERSLLQEVGEVLSLDDDKRVERSLLPEVGEVLSLDNSKRVERSLLPEVGEVVEYNNVKTSADIGETREEAKIMMPFCEYCISLDDIIRAENSLLFEVGSAGEVFEHNNANMNVEIGAAREEAVTMMPVIPEAGEEGQSMIPVTAKNKDEAWPPQPSSTVKKCICNSEEYKCREGELSKEDEKQISNSGAELNFEDLMKTFF